MNESMRENLIRTIQKLDDENLLAVSQYIDFLCDSGEEAPSDEDVQAILKGRQEFDLGEYTSWEKTSF